MSDQFIGQTLAEKYRIDSIVRDGDLGKIYRATHLLMDKPVTVKILAPALSVDQNIVKQFSAEARTVSHISHPNILNVTDFGAEKNGAVYIVLEGADGETLKEAIGREGIFSLDRAVKIAAQISSALSAAHAYGINHGNLNGENVLLTKTADEAEIVKILDFGAAQVTESNLADDEIFAENLEYRSPEQNSSVAEVDGRSDIYALGVIVYEMLAGEVPYAANTPTELLLKQAENPPAPLSAFRTDLPAAIEPIILKALAKNPEMRYQSAHEFTDDLNRAANNFGETETIVIPKAAELTDNARNNLWKTAFVVLAGISLLAIGLIYATASKQINPATQLQTDVNGQPVQPLNPATGMNEFGASNLMPYTPQMLANSNMIVPPSSANPNSDGLGDGYNPWARGVPPPGAPTYVPPGGQYVDPNNPNSIFMQDGTVLVPVPANSNANVKPAATPTGKPTPAPANTNAQPSPTPATNTQPIPVKTPTPKAKPTVQPTKTPPAAPEKRAQSGKEQDS